MCKEKNTKVFTLMNFSVRVNYEEKATTSKFIASNYVLKDVSLNSK